MFHVYKELVYISYGGHRVFDLDEDENSKSDVDSLSFREHRMRIPAENFVEAE